MKLFLATFALTLAGCSGMGGFGNGVNGSMTAEQISAAVKDKSSAAACMRYTGPGGQVETLFVNNDKTFGTGGGETTIDCGSAKVTFKDSGKAAAVPKVPAP